MNEARYYVIDPDTGSVLAGPCPTIEALQNSIEESIDDGDIELAYSEYEYDILAVVGTLTAFNRPATKVELFKENK